jgi:hypothetical protein
LYAVFVFTLLSKWWSSAVELVGEGGRGGQREALSTASSPVRRQPHRPQIHSATPRGCIGLRWHAQPDPLLSLELVPQQWCVHALAFVAKPEQLPE